MRRPLTFGLVVIVAALAPSVIGLARAAGQVDGVRSGGIGLPRAAWDETHGPGEVGQSLVTYEGGTYTVGFQGDIVAFVEVGWEAPGVAAAEAEAAVRDLIPSDARLVDTFAAPATAGGPIALRLDRYESAALLDSLPAAGAAPTGGILVVSQETAAPDRFEPNVVRVSIATGTASS